jgi:mitogen-activated protein kinase organizer 1
MMTKELIVASSIDGSVRTYDVRRGKMTDINIGQAINSFDLSSTYCATSCMDSVARIIDLQDFKSVADFKGHH